MKLPDDKDFPPELARQTIVKYMAIILQMQERLNILDALEAGGVDNWEGYHEATQHLYADDED